MNEEGRPIMRLRTGLVLYAILLAGSVILLKGPARILAVIIVAALAVKSVLYQLRSNLDKNERQSD
jgi:hypothetical protein